MSELGIVIDSREDYQVVGDATESTDLEEFLIEMKENGETINTTQTSELLVSNQDDLEEELLFINEIV